MEHTWEFIYWTTIIYLTYWNYAQMDIALVKYYEMSKVMQMACYLLTDTSTWKSPPRTYS